MKLKESRQRAGLSRAQLSIKTGISDGLIREIETGKILFDTTGKIKHKFKNILEVNLEMPNIKVKV